MSEDPEEANKWLPTDDLQLKLMRNVFDWLMKAYDEEYDFVCSYFKDFGLHDRVRILKDIKSFPDYV